MGHIIFGPQGKLDLLEHPIFELFILLKWARVHLLFKVNFELMLLMMLLLMLLMMRSVFELFVLLKWTSVNFHFKL